MATRGKVRKSVLRDTNERPVKWRKYPHLFLIVCEDQKTEPYYFKAFIKEFPKETVYLRPVGTGRSSKDVVEQAIVERKKLYEEANKNVDEVWAVFDKDDAEKSKGNTQRFQEAFEIAQKEHISVAYSNEVFELWLLLHFADVSSEVPMPRIDIYSRLETSIKQIPIHDDFVYQHGDTQVIDIVIQSGNESKAIERAAQLNTKHKTKSALHIDANPNTTVNVLVKRLRDLIEWYSYIPN